MCDHRSSPRDRAIALEQGRAHDHDHEAWTRRDFLVRAGLGAAGGALLFHAPPTRALGHTPLLDALARIETDRVLVLVQLIHIHHILIHLINHQSVNHLCPNHRADQLEHFHL